MTAVKVIDRGNRFADKVRSDNIPADVLQDLSKAKQWLAEAERAVDVCAESAAEVSRLEAEQERLVTKHQQSAQKIQERLTQPGLTMEQRAGMREELHQLGDDLQRACDEVNARIETAQAAYEDAFVVKNRINALRAALQNMACDETKAELEAAERYREVVAGVARDVQKRIAELEFSLDQLRGDEPTGESWGWGKVNRPQASSVDIARVEHALAVEKGVHSWLGKGVVAAATEAVRLRREIEGA